VLFPSPNLPGIPAFRLIFPEASTILDPEKSIWTRIKSGTSDNVKRNLRSLLEKELTCKVKSVSEQKYCHWPLEVE